MTAKRYQIYVNRKKYDYTYDPDTGVVRTKLPGMSEFITTQAPNSDDARMDVRQMIERVTGQTAQLAPVRAAFLRAILALGPDGHRMTEDNLAAALGRVSNALDGDQRRVLGISERWRRHIAHANAVNDASLLSADDAADLATIVSEAIIFGSR